jgi:hypothetical protein
MKFSDEPGYRHQRPYRPTGVSILTILNGFSAGFLPAFSAISQIASAADQNLEGLTLTALCLSVGLPVAIISAAIGAFMGSDRSRLALLILVTLFFSLRAFQNASLALAGAIPEDQQVLAYGRIFWSALWIGINVWYFLRPSTIAFYRRPV